MTIRCKFYCQKVAAMKWGHGEGACDAEEVVLQAVTSNGAADDPNKAWSKYTPAGSFTITITNPAAMGQFRPGKSYFLDVTPADE